MSKCIPHDPLPSVVSVKAHAAEGRSESNVRATPGKKGGKKIWMACALAKLLALRQLPGEIEGEGFWLVEVGPCCHGDGNGFGSVRRAIRRALRVWRKQLLIWSLTPCETDIWINCAQTCLRNTPRRGTPCMIVSIWASVRIWVGENKKIELFFLFVSPSLPGLSFEQAKSKCGQVTLLRASQHGSSSDSMWHS